MRFLFAFLLVTSAARADLLVEITWQNPVPLALPIRSGFTSVNDVMGAGWTSELPRDGQFGERLIADAATVARLNDKLTTPPSSSAINVLFANGDQQPCGDFCQHYSGYAFDHIVGGPDFIWSTGPLNANGFTAVAYVPQLGQPNQALTGYRLTGLERVVTPTSQTVYFYGSVAVPEPVTYALLISAVGIAAVGFRAVRRRLDRHAVMTLEYRNICGPG